MALLFATLAQGCETGDPPLNQPRISDLRREVPPRFPTMDQPPQYATALAVALQMAFHPRARLDDAIDMLDQDGFDPDLLYHLERNGIFLGTIPAGEESWRDFNDRLPVPLYTQATRTWVPIDDPDGLRPLTVARFGGSRRVEIIGEESESDPDSDVHPAVAGQWLGRLRTLTGGNLILDLTPNLHRPRPIFGTVEPQQRQIMGTRVDDLAIHWRGGEQRMLVMIHVASDRPQDQPAEPEADTRQDETEEKVEHDQEDPLDHEDATPRSENSADPAGRPEPLSLGEALLSPPIQGQPSRGVIIIRCPVGPIQEPRPIVTP